MIKAIPTEVWAGKSTDEKPKKNVPDNQTLYEKDTKKTFIFDSETNEWYEV
jgi:hypothetical protein